MPFVVTFSPYIGVLSFMWPRSCSVLHIIFISLPMRTNNPDQVDPLAALKLMLDTGPLHHPTNVIVSNNSQANHPSTITDISVSSGPTSYFCSPENTNEHIAET